MKSGGQQGRVPVVGLLACAVAKLEEARVLADHLTDFEDMEDTETGNMATNFLCGKVATAKGGRA